MTIYTGESVEILNSATDFDKVTVLTPDLIPLVQVEIVDTDLTVVLPNSTMAWDAARNTWFYIWTAPTTAGTYRAKVSMTGFGTLTWEYLRIRVKAKLF